LAGPPPDGVGVLCAGEKGGKNLNGLANIRPGRHIPPELTTDFYG
jgi:hypothetical protein